MIALGVGVAVAAIALFSWAALAGSDSNKAAEAGTGESDAQPSPTATTAPTSSGATESAPATVTTTTAAEADDESVVQGWKRITVDGELFDFTLAYPVVGIPPMDRAIEAYAIEIASEEVPSMDSITAEDPGLLSSDAPAISDWTLEPGFISAELTSLTLTGFTTYGGVGWDPNETVIFDSGGLVVTVPELLNDAERSGVALRNAAVEALIAHEVAAGGDASYLCVECGEFNYGLEADGALAAHALPDTFSGTAFASPTVIVGWNEIRQWLDSESVLAAAADGRIRALPFAPVAEPVPVVFDYEPISPEPTVVSRYSYFNEPSVIDLAETGPLYSGCSPGSSNTLPDGLWIGYVDTWTSTSLTVDLVCVEIKDGRDFEYPVVTNNNPILRVQPISPSASGYPWWNGYDQRMTTSEALDEISARHTMGPPPYLLIIAVNGGDVTEIVEWFWS